MEYIHPPGTNAGRAARPALARRLLLARRMGTLPQARSVLRLASAETAPEAQGPTHARDSAARRDVARENRLAAQLEPGDARWAVAMRARDLLEGGRAAVLTRDRRRRLVRLATRVGLREFDANLIIAIVQDEARTGEAQPRTGPPGLPTDGIAARDAMARRIAMVRPVPRRTHASPWPVLVAAAIIAVVGVMLAIRWLTS